jgi:putative solute:sodium symporter small subunit
METPTSTQTQDRMQEYWRKNITLILTLLGIWALVSYVLGILLVRGMNTFQIGQLPAGFWFAQQGSIYVFVVLIFVYARRMDKLDKEYDVQE